MALVITYQEGRYATVRLNSGEYAKLSMAQSGIEIIQMWFGTIPAGTIANWGPDNLDGFLELFGGESDRGTPFRFAVDRLSTFSSIKELKKYLSNATTQEGLKTMTALRQSLAEMNRRRDEEAEAARIVRAFAEVLGSSTDRIRDAKMLPFPKQVIRNAFARRIQFFKTCCEQEPDNPEWSDGLKWVQSGVLHLSSFQDIDPTDLSAVQAANSGDLDERREILLFLKYHQRGMKEDGIVVDNALERPGEVLSFNELCKRFNLA